MFIKLTSLILNTRLINSILIRSDKYYISFDNSIIDGILFFPKGRYVTDSGF